MPFVRSRWADSYFDWLYKNRRLVNVIFVLLTLVGAFFTSKLQLKTDFATLLPDKLASVQNLRRAQERVGGTGALLIGVESPSFAANKRFMNDLHDRLQPLMGNMLRYAEYKYHESRDYLYKYGLHYLSDPELDKFNTFLEETIVREKDKSVGSFLGLNDDDDKKQKSSTTLEGLNPQLATLLRYPDAYLGSPDGKLLVMFARPLSSSLGVGKNREILGKIKEIVASVNPQAYHPEMFVGYGGNVVSSIEEMETIRADLFDTALLLVLLLLGTLFLFLWSWRLIFLICLALVAAVIWTFAFTQIFIGYLNTQTVFLGSLVVGTGVNYAVIFICRYLENRRAGQEMHGALVASLRDTLIATLVASSTTVIAFVSLFLAQNRGLSQFGFIGSIGIIFVWLLTYSVLPIWVYSWELRKPTPANKTNPLSHRASRWVAAAGRAIVTHYRVVLGLTLAISLFSVVGVVKLFRDPLEPNFDKLRNKVTKEAGVAAFEKKMQATLPTSRTPAPVLLETDAEAREVCAVVEDIASKQPPEKAMIHMCMSLYKMLPKDYTWTPARKEKFLRIQKTLQNPLLKYSDQADNLFGIRDHMSFTAPTLEQLPEEIKVRFREKDGQVGRIAFVSARPEKTLSNSVYLFEFVEPLSHIPLPSSGRVTTAVGDSFVLADLFRSVHHDGMVVGISAFVGVILIAIFLAGGLRAGLLMSLCLVLGTLWMMGLQGFVGIKYNFFNFIALPLTFGIGVDYPINVYLRYRQEGFRNYPVVLVGSGVAVVLCCLLTTIGYLTLVGATSQALVSFAKLALIGEIACVVTAIFVLPAVMEASGKFKQP